MPKCVLAIAAHPDDIEFMMAGTFILLGQAGFEMHYLNVADGRCGTDSLDVDDITRIREAEAREAAALIGATYHPSFCPDIGVFYEATTVAKLAAIIREVAPDIVLTHGYHEYMEDHANVCRLAVTASFCRGMRNFESMPARAPINKPLALYHAMPYGLHGPQREPISPHIIVNIGDAIKTKRAMLACHHSQKEWLDVSQGLNAYLDTQTEMSRKVGSWSGRFEHGEGWIRHSHLGFCSPDEDPLVEALPDHAHKTSHH